MQFLHEREIHNYNSTSITVSPGYTDIPATTSTTTDLWSYNATSTTTAIYDTYSITNATVLLSTASVSASSSSSGSFVSPDNIVNGSQHNDVLTRVAVSCVSCVAILLVVVPLVIWRCRVFQQHTISTSAALDKYGTSFFPPCTPQNVCHFLSFLVCICTG